MAQVAADLAQATRIPIDTESNSLHAYREMVCYIQILGPTAAHLVDTVAIRNLDQLEASLGRGPVKILHGADYDVVCMKRDFGFGPDPLFDTMIASQLLGYEALGLAALVDRYCDVYLDKGFQKHDWGARPLDPVAEPYLVADVRYLLTLHDALSEELEEADLTEEAELEFARVAALDWSPPAADEPDAFLRMKGAKDLDRRGLAVLRELHRLRESLASAVNRPAFKVLGNHQLLALAERRPSRESQLQKVPGFKPHIVRRHGAAVLSAIEEGLHRIDELPDDLRPRRRPARRGRGPDQQIEEALRDWRKGKAARSGLTPMALLPNHVLLEIAALRPARASEIAEIAGMATRRRETLVSEILGVVRGAS